VTFQTYPNLFDRCPPFQIDGNFGATAGIAEMLLQSHIQDEKGIYEIHLLPARPSAWAEGSVSGLRARGGVTVDLIWQTGKLTTVRLVADHDMTCKVRLGKDVKEISLSKGKVLHLNGDLKPLVNSNK